MNELPIKELLERCLRTDNPADWDEFAQRTQPTVRDTVSWNLGWSNPNRNLVEDLVNESYIKLFANKAKVLRGIDWPDGESILRYLRATARSVVADYFRSRQGKMRSKESSLEETEGQVPGAPEHILDDLEHKQQIERIERCLKTLSVDPKEEEMFWLHYRQGWSARAIAELPSIQLPVKTVENMLLRLVRQIRTKLNRGD